MRIEKKIGKTVTLEISETEFNFLRNVITGFQINTSKRAWATHSGFNEEEINNFLNEMFEEAEKFNIEL